MTESLNNRRLTGGQSKKKLPERMNGSGKGSEVWKGMACASTQLGT